MKNLVKKEIEKLIKKLNLDCSIREFKNEVNWNYISYSQKLSLDFIREFQDKVSWGLIEIYQNITKKDIEEYEKKIEEEELNKVIEENNKTRVKNKFQLIRF